MSTEKKIILTITSVAVGIIFVANVINTKKENKGKDNIPEETITRQEGTSGVNPSDPSYEGKKVYKENGDTIIEEKDGGKTIETTKTKENTGLTQATAEQKQKYEITNVEVQLRGETTLITGKIKNNDIKNRTLTVKAKFYSNDNKTKGSVSTKLELSKGETKDFTMSIMDDVTKYKYKVEVEYVK